MLWLMPWHHRIAIIIGVAISTTAGILAYHFWHIGEISWKTSSIIGVGAVVWNCGLIVYARQMEMRGCRKRRGFWVVIPGSKS
jgi:hypothetical protein